LLTLPNPHSRSPWYTKWYTRRSAPRNGPSQQRENAKVFMLESGSDGDNLGRRRFPAIGPDKRQTGVAAAGSSAGQSCIEI
jgi:hypothetical protein